jgi:hypothetical protein
MVDKAPQMDRLTPHRAQPIVIPRETVAGHHPEGNVSAR